MLRVRRTSVCASECEPNDAVGTRVRSPCACGLSDSEATLGLHVQPEALFLYRRQALYYAKEKLVKYCGSGLS